MNNRLTRGTMPAFSVTRFLCALSALMLLAVGAAFAGGHAAPSLADIAEGDHRSEANKARNEYRHPVETLEFFQSAAACPEYSHRASNGPCYRQLARPASAAVTG